jgi:hypothetical protein
LKPRQLVWILRAVVFLHAALLLAQALFAGQFLEGSRAALRWRGFNGTTVIMSVALVHCILAFVAWRKRLQSAGFLVGSVALYITEGAQIGFGFGDRLELHVPLGVLIFGAAALLCLLSVRQRPAQAKD